jgi:cellulose synthase/poly-beta-1,6-N-acetylglucosamine synthase-like glycosyltransferase
LIVVADNCSDDTFEVAKAAGAEAIRRQDPDRRGKGFALDFGVRHLHDDPPETVIIVDADCLPNAGSLNRIAALSSASMRPVQARYLMELPPRETSLAMQVAAFAWLIKNYVRPLGLHRFGLPCQLMGSGMAFPWRIISEMRLATDEIVEDLVHGLTLAEDGYAPLFCPEARVTSTFPISREGQASQRARWKTGHLKTINRLLPRLFFKALRSRNLQLFALATDACVPPLAFFSLTIAALTLASLALFAAGGSATPLALALVCALGFALSVLLAWRQVGRGVISIAKLSLAPVYAIQHLALYGRIMIGRKLGWVRTKRD